MLLINWKVTVMWVLPKDGENHPSKFTTKESIENRLNEYKPPWESYFEEHINDSDSIVTFKEKRLKCNKYEPIFEGELITSKF